MTQGWIKLHRQLREASFYGQAIPIAIWVECLLRASHDERDRFIGREKIHLKAGSFVMGYQELADTVGCGKATAKAWLDLFEKEGMVERQRTAKGTICKLKKWSEYQDARPLTDQERTADGPLTDPNKNEKNEKNEKKTSVSGAVAPTPGQQARDFFKNDERQEETIQRLIAKGQDEDTVRAEIKKFCSYWTERTKDGRKQLWETKKTFEVKKRLVTWLNNNFPSRNHDN